MIMIIAFGVSATLLAIITVLVAYILAIFIDELFRQIIVGNMTCIRKADHFDGEVEHL